MTATHSAGSSVESTELSFFRNGHAVKGLQLIQQLTAARDFISTHNQNCVLVATQLDCRGI